VIQGKYDCVSNLMQNSDHSVRHCFLATLQPWLTWHSLWLMFWCAFSVLIWTISSWCTTTDGHKTYGYLNSTESQINSHYISSRIRIINQSRKACCSAWYWYLRARVYVQRTIFQKFLNISLFTLKIVGDRVASKRKFRVNLECTTEHQVSSKSEREIGNKVHRHTDVHDDDNNNNNNNNNPA
jgi:hypothetical protein